MNLTEMLTTVRNDLRDQDPSGYRWSDEELKGHIAHAVKDLSFNVPLEATATLATISGEREIDISSLSGALRIEAIEYPTGLYPPRYQRFGGWAHTSMLLGEEVPDGSDCKIYYGKMYTLTDSESNIPEQLEYLIAVGAAGYAAQGMQAYSIDRVNNGGANTARDWAQWSHDKLALFREDIKRMSYKNRVRARQMYTPYNPPVSKATDWGPG